MTPRHKTFDDDGIRQLLAQRIQAAGSRAKWAESVGLLPTPATSEYLRQIITGARSPSARVLEALGLERRVTYTTRR